MLIRNKSIHELRAIAQGFGVTDIFAKDQVQLSQAIEMKQKDMVPEPKVEIPKPEYDARLMTKPPAKRGYEHEVKDLLAPYVARGMHLSFPEPEVWAMSFGKKNDTGSMRMPLRVILSCADKLMSGRGK